MVHYNRQEAGGDDKGARSIGGISMSINGIAVDLSRGFDVMFGSRVLRRFDTYEEAQAYAAQGRRRYVRYWGLKPQTAEGK